jgi:hypothetical protein
MGCRIANELVHGKEAMSIQGIVKDGVVILPHGVAPADGTPVQVEVLAASDSDGLAKDLLEWAGKGANFPSDLAENHDHYLHGRPKK